MRYLPPLEAASFITSGASNLPQARQLTAGDHVQLTDGGAQGTLQLEWLPDWSRVVQLYSDFVNFGDWINHGAGTGATNSFSNTGDGTHQGIISHSTGTTATGYAGVGSASVADTRFGTSLHDLLCVFRLGALSDATNGFSARVGYFDRRNATSPLDGAYFSYTHSVGSGNWQVEVYSAGVSAGPQDTGVPGDTSWHSFRIVVAADASGADFYIDGNLVYQASSGLPSGSGRETGVTVGLIKTAGTTARLAYTDLLALRMVVSR